MNRLPFIPSMSDVPASVLDGTDPWQMAFGERAAFFGLLADQRPQLAIEIGTAEGGSLRRIAHLCPEVHSFDLVTPAEEVLAGLDNVHVHTGDSHELVPAFLAELAEQGRNVDFALVDGDHSAAGVQQDMEDLLRSDAVRRTVIVMHDSNNEEVRRGLEAVDYDSFAKVRHVDLDFVPGYHFRGALEGELWAGLALVVVDADRPRAPGESAHQVRYHPHHHQMVLARDAAANAGAVADRDALRTQLAATRERLGAVQEELAYLQRMHHAVTGSPSWRITAPLRAAKAAVLARRPAR